MGIILFGAKLYLLFNLLLGKDTVVKLSADKENFFLQQGQTEKVSFKTQILTNPFCNSYCSFSFTNLATGELIDSGNFEVQPALPDSREYELSTNKAGKGQELYGFDIECKSVKSDLCHTKGEVASRRALITFDYDLSDEEFEIKDSSKEEIISSIQYISSSFLNLEKLGQEINNSNNKQELGSFGNKITVFSSELLLINQTAYSLKNDWEKSDYSSISRNLDSLTSSIDVFKLKMEDFLLEIDYYNSFARNLTPVYTQIEGLVNVNTSKELSEEVDGLILDFNSLKLSTKSFSEKNSLLASLSERTYSLSQEIGESSESCCFAMENLIRFSLSEIEMPQEISVSEVYFKEPVGECCLFGNCQECCDDSCKTNKESLPIIFLHGHDFNRATSAEASLNTFVEIQKQIEGEGYINAGPIWISEEDEKLSGILGRNKNPISFTASYYFDLYKNTGKTVLIETKADNLDRYALRLKDIIEEAKYKTGRDKVVIVTHSMGGLVVRKYIQIFGEVGEENIDKIIMIGTPNNGVSGTISKYCYVFGSIQECNDLSSSSLFISKINSAKKIKTPVYNIIGTGCETDGEQGDGIVTETSAFFGGADLVENYYIGGTCDLSSLIFFHTELINPYKYPEVYQLIVEFLKK